MSESTSPTGQEARCDYCRRPKAEVGPLMRGGGENPVTICRGCVTLATTAFDAQDRQRATKPERLATIPSPRDIVAHLDRSVIGQGRAKRTLAIAVSNHFKRLLDASDRGAADPVVADPALRDVDHREEQRPADRPQRLGQDPPGQARWPSTSASPSPSPTPRR